MATNTGSMCSSIMKLSAPKLGLLYTRSESASLSGSNLVMRLVCTLTQRPQQQPPPQDQEIGSTKVEEDESGIREQIQIGEEGNDDDEEDDIDLNKDTGEVGGPRGPEPTRYGDWEQKGRCSDF